MSISELIIKQDSLRQLLETAIVNYKKTALARRTQGYIKGRLEYAKGLWKEVFTNHLSIVQLISTLPSEKGKEINYSTEYLTNTEEIFHEFIGLLNDALDSVVKTNSKPDKVATTSNSNPSIRLPEISLPKFSGSYDNWRSFHDLFTSLVHTNQNLTSIQKFHYLKTSVVGEAEHLLRQYQLTESNYETAWSALKNRYENKRVLVNTQLKILFSQSPLHSESAKGVKSLIDRTTECLCELKSLKVDTTSWDPILIYHLTQKLPVETRRIWEEKLGSTQELPTFQILQEFLESRFRTLEALTDNKSSEGQKHKTLTHHIISQKPCVFCKINHKAHQCPKLLNLQGPKRLELVRSKQLCVNCLSNTHKLYNCTSKFTCHICGRKHHTLLHISTNDSTKTMQTSSQTNKLKSKSDQNSNNKNTKQLNQSSETSTQTFCTYKKQQYSSVALLSTALVKIKSKHGLNFTFRALIDSGSQTSFITENAAQKLQLKRDRTSIQVSGLGNSKTVPVKYQSIVSIQTRTNESVAIKTLIVRKITDLIPPSHLNIQNLSHIKDLDLADPTFHTPGRIDILLGADAYASILLEGLRKGAPGTPVAQNSVLGWILIGGKMTSKTTNSMLINTYEDENLNNTLTKFWEVEEVISTPKLSKEDQHCEDFYKRTHLRKQNGRYEVRLPFIEEKPNLGDSKAMALRQFYALERRFIKKPELRKEYTKCMEEYISMGHMKEVSDNKHRHSCYYLPHHAVFKDSTTTKLRVVFNASAKTTNGLSLNDQLHTGPILQTDIFPILLNWRKYPYVMNADIEKMYRMIDINKEDQTYQRIFWRSSPKEPLKEYELSTVTFGTKPAPYLAMRTLHQLADDEHHNYPDVSSIIKKQFYVDDAFLGAYSIHEALHIQNQILNLMKSGGFNLRKWVGNKPELLQNIPDHMREVNFPLKFANDESVKTLGIFWYPVEDYFAIQYREIPDRIPTKRNILSEVAKLFDPLGWISPIIITAKILMQKLWLSGCSWDDPVPANLAAQWQTFKNELKYLDKIKIPRYIQTDRSWQNCQLHGFADASNSAYSAAIYLRVASAERIYVSLLTAKSKVAPTKPISLPRLELNGALLLARLIKRVKNDLEIPNITVFAWTDSTITLSWVKTNPNKYKTYVANRVSEIQDIIKPESWHHISTIDNPADCNSRGIKVSGLNNHSLWWQGPQWLSLPQDQWPQCKITNETKCEKILEFKRCMNVTISDSIDSYISRFSSFLRLLRVTTYCLRFYKKCKRIKSTFPSYLSSEELFETKYKLLKIVQNLVFYEDINNLSNNKPISNKSNLLSLNPFLDSKGLLKVGGRLANSNLSYNQRHPIILPKTPNHLTKLIIEYFHHKTLHGGVELVLNTLRNEYWLCNGRNSIRFTLHHCIICFKSRPKVQNQLMANLPASRCNISRPFQKIGIDYAGPIYLKMSKHRPNRTYKGYICLFICMVTKAIHIEPVSDLTTAAFIAVFRRFVSRRGPVSDCYSDCGTNFVGGNKHLQNDLHAAIKCANEQLASEIASQGTKWHFNPPASPHFGGLWEAGVKSIKYHLSKILKESLLTFEELTTILTQIEACLNSRPLYPLTDDPDDIQALTPAHFLIGSSLLHPPEPIIDQAMSLRSRWQHIQMLHQQFWKQWSKQYLSQLQNRPKWQRIRSNPEKDDLVVIKDENLTPCKWPLGRIIEVHPGLDNIIRVVTIKTQNSILKRPISKICILPTTK